MTKGAVALSGSPLTVHIDLLKWQRSHHPEDAEYLAQDHAIVHDDRIHRVILGLEADMSVFLVESLDSSAVLNERNYDFSVSCCSA